MHAVVVRVNIKDPEPAEKMLHEQIVPQVSQAPGFVAGYWSQSDDRTNGMGTIIVESEDVARGMKEQLESGDAENPDLVELESVEVRRVVASA